MKPKPVNSVPARAGEVNPATLLKTRVVRGADQTMPEAAALMAREVQRAAAPREAVPVALQEAVETNNREGSQA